MAASCRWLASSNSVLDALEAANSSSLDDILLGEGEGAGAAGGEARGGSGSVPHQAGLRGFLINVFGFQVGGWVGGRGLWFSPCIYSSFQLQVGDVSLRYTKQHPQLEELEEPFLAGSG